MRFRVGAIPECAEFTPCDPWRPLREPGLLLMQIIALPLGIGVAAVVGVAWLAIAPAGDVWSLPPFAPLLIILGIIPVHELIHAAVHPGMGRTHESLLGLWPSRGVFYAHYDGELSRNRLIAILAMPFVVISLLPLVVCGVLGVTSPVIAFASTLNAFMSYGDLFGITLLLWQTPRTSRVRNQGWRTYWKTAAELPAVTE